jgi:PPOX class probable F420-dependent enzyme
MSKYSVSITFLILSQLSKIDISDILEHLQGIYAEVTQQGLAMTIVNSPDISSEPIIKFFADRNFAFISTINKDGSPQVTPTWIDLDEKHGLILINTAVGRLKQKNVSRDPRVSISMIDGRVNPYSMVTIKGKVIEQSKSGADEHIDKLARKYLNTDKYPAHSPKVTRIILKIKPEKISYLPPRYTQYHKRD